MGSGQLRIHLHLHVKEKASKASAKHAELEAGVCKQHEKEKWRGCRHL